MESLVSLVENPSSIRFQRFQLTRSHRHKDGKIGMSPARWHPSHHSQWAPRPDRGGQLRHFSVSSRQQSSTVMALWRLAVSRLFDCLLQDGVVILPNRGIRDHTWGITKHKTLQVLGLSPCIKRHCHNLQGSPTSISKCDISVSTEKGTSVGRLFPPSGWQSLGPMANMKKHCCKSTVQVQVWLIVSLGCLGGLFVYFGQTNKCQESSCYVKWSEAWIGTLSMVWDYITM